MSLPNAVGAQTIPSEKESWIPLMDYAARTGISLSTLRRHIKAHKIPFRVEQGRYLLQYTEGQAGGGDLGHEQEQEPTRDGAEADSISEASRRRGAGATSAGPPKFAARPRTHAAGTPAAASTPGSPAVEIGAASAAAGQARIENELLSIELKKAREEIAELKTLIAFYEERMFHSPGR